MNGTKHIVGFSGGIDSEATLRWVLNRCGPANVIATNTLAGRNESPLTEAFIAEFSRDVFPVITIAPLVRDLYKTENYAEDSKGIDGNEELTFERLIELKGRPPSRKAQFCTIFLKLVPQKRWLDEQFGVGGQYEGLEYVRYTGVRRDESQSRANQAFREWDGYFDCWLEAPITDWTKQMCFDYVRAADWPVNPLYSLGFNRVGCAPCINSGKDDILKWLQRFPEMIDKIRAYEQNTGKTYFASCVPGLYMNNIDQVIEWAKTDRGGWQTNMFRVLNDSPTCESKYGLCE